MLYFSEYNIQVLNVGKSWEFSPFIQCTEYALMFGIYCQSIPSRLANLYY